MDKGAVLIRFNVVDTFLSLIFGHENPEPRYYAIIVNFAGEEVYRTGDFEKSVDAEVAGLHDFRQLLRKGIEAREEKGREELDLDILAAATGGSGYAKRTNVSLYASDLARITRLTRKLRLPEGPDRSKRSLVIRYALSKMERDMT